MLAVRIVQILPLWIRQGGPMRDSLMHKRPVPEGGAAQGCVSTRSVSAFIARNAIQCRAYRAQGRDHGESLRSANSAAAPLKYHRFGARMRIPQGRSPVRDGP